MVVSVLYIQYSIPIWNYGLVPSFKLFKAEILRNLSSNCVSPPIHTPSRDCVESLSQVQLFATPRTVALQAPLFMGFLFFQARILEGVAMPSSRGSSQPRDRTRSPALQADSLPAELPGKTYWIDDSIWCTFPELLCRYGNPPPNGRCELFDDQEHTPQGSRSLRTDKVNPCDITLFPHYYPVRELCTSWIHILRPHSLTRLLKKALPKPFGALRAF